MGRVIEVQILDIIYIYIYIYIYIFERERERGAHAVIVIIVGNEQSELGSKPGQGNLLFSLS